MLTDINQVHDTPDSRAWDGTLNITSHDQLTRTNPRRLAGEIAWDWSNPAPFTSFQGGVPIVADGRSTHRADTIFGYPWMPGVTAATGS